MKYYNKRKKIRQRLWTLVVIPCSLESLLYDSQKWQDMRKWCTEYNNTKNRFYVGFYKWNEWWFEDPQDAIVFKLKWLAK